VPVPTLRDIFAMLMAQRTLRPNGYIRYQNGHLYGQEGLTGKRAGVLLMKETLTITYSAQL
jgi:hypothetical protein